MIVFDSMCRCVPSVTKNKKKFGPEKTKYFEDPCRVETPFGIFRNTCTAYQRVETPK